MKSLDRLKHKFKKNGIIVSYDNGIYCVKNEQAQAEILLPDSFILEEKAVAQLLDFASVSTGDGRACVCKACATPDFHPGAIAPVGSVVATSADYVIPAAIGTDINCGMRLITTGLSFDSANANKQKLIAGLKHVLLESGRNIPMLGSGFYSIFNNALEDGINDLPDSDGLWDLVDKDSLVADLSKCIGLSNFQSSAKHAPEALLANRVIRDPCLGTPGSGNHFVELQVVEEIFDKQAAWANGLKKGDIVVMLHSGSRDVGFFVGQQWMDRAKQAWKAGVKHPTSGLYALEGPLAQEYLVAMGTAARYAWLNRVVLGEMVKQELAKSLGLTQFQLVVDVPHNVVMSENGYNVHRKGATPAHQGDLALIPGSMGTASYVATGLGNPDWLYSCSHGAGRSVKRQDMRSKVTEQATEKPFWECITLREERKIEESPMAYKDIGPVISSQIEQGLISSVAKLKPWVTFKA